MTIYFDNCLASCRAATIAIPDGTGVSAIIDACRAKWGEGSLMRSKPANELVWVHDLDEPWIGCCAEKVYGKKSTR